MIRVGTYSNSGLRTWYIEDREVHGIHFYDESGVYYNARYLETTENRDVQAVHLQHLFKRNKLDLTKQENFYIRNGVTYNNKPQYDLYIYCKPKVSSFTPDVDDGTLVVLHYYKKFVLHLKVDIRDARLLDDEKLEWFTKSVDEITLQVHSHNVETEFGIGVIHTAKMLEDKGINVSKDSLAQILRHFTLTPK